MMGRGLCSALCCALLLAHLGAPTSVEGKRRPTHTKHHSVEAAAEREAQPQIEIPSFGGYLEEEDDEGEETSTIVPLEAAQEHFSLMPDRPVVEPEEPAEATAAPLVQLSSSATAASGAGPSAAKGPGHAQGKSVLPFCTAADLGKMTRLTGKWVDHPSPEHIGYYDPRSDCPEWAEDFNCLRPYPPAKADPELAAREFRQVFQADRCQLRQFDAPGFEKCLAGRRLFLIGDSLMRQQFASLACLLKSVSKSGKSARWDLSDLKWQGEYVQAWGQGTTSTSKQFVGDVELNNGAKVVIRSFGTYNAQLWDDVLSDFAPITADDVILVNFGAWYPRFKVSEPEAPWIQWQGDMSAMFMDKLVKTPGQVIWKDYSPSHFCGATGTFTGIDESLSDVPSRAKCEPASVGEFWYRDWVETFLNTTCGDGCSKIKVLPIFDLSLIRHDSHHGSFGRGRYDDKATDCRHFCNNVVDYWNEVLYNIMCA